MKKNKTQLQPANLKRLFSNFCNWSFTIILVLASTGISVAQTNNTIVRQEFETYILNSPIFEKKEEITLSGYVYDIKGTPIANALLTTISGSEYHTDINGEFSFKLKKEEIKVQNFFASYIGLVSEVRSYDPAMSNAVYNIILHKPLICCPRDSAGSTASNPILLNYVNTSTELSQESKKRLDSATRVLKENPGIKISLTAFSSSRKSLQRLADLRLDNIQKYLIEQNGISRERIKIINIPDTNNKNVIEIKLTNNE